MTMPYKWGISRTELQDRPSNDTLEEFPFWSAPSSDARLLAFTTTVIVRLMVSKATKLKRGE